MFKKVELPHTSTWGSLLYVVVNLFHIFQYHRKFGSLEHHDHVRTLWPSCQKEKNFRLTAKELARHLQVIKVQALPGSTANASPVCIFMGTHQFFELVYLGVYKHPKCLPRFPLWVTNGFLQNGFISLFSLDACSLYFQFFTTAGLRIMVSMMRVAEKNLTLALQREW